MTTSPLSLVHLTRAPVAATAGPPPLLLLLHGIGSNERDLFGLTPALDGRFFVVSARAPIPLGLDAFAWFRLDFTPRGPVADATEAERSREVLIRFIGEAVAAYGLDPRRVYLLGFSQGAIMSLAVALTRPDLLAGVVAMSGRLPASAADAVEADAEALTDLPILMVHGVADQVLPLHHGREARDHLAALPVALTYREYPMGHEVTPESLRDIAAWLTAQLDGAAEMIDDRR